MEWVDHRGRQCGQWVRGSRMQRTESKKLSTRRNVYSGRGEWKWQPNKTRQVGLWTKMNGSGREAGRHAGARFTKSWHDSSHVFRDLCQLLLYVVSVWHDFNASMKNWWIPNMLAWKSCQDILRLKGKCWHDFHAKCRWHDFWHDFWHELVNTAPGVKK